ncbi:MAG: Uma2 family endonuclease [Caldilineaceae bacterium]
MAPNILLAPTMPEPLTKGVSDAFVLQEAENIPEDVVIWRLSVEQYHAIAAAGILAEDDPVELLEGLLVYKMTKNPPHSVTTQLIQAAFQRILPNGWHIRAQEPVTLADSEPEPDIMPVAGDIRHYITRHPGPQDVGLLVEVADATLKRDRGSKKRVYARAGIAVYWVVNLIEKRIEVYTNPSGGARKADYQTQQNYGLEAEVPVVIDEVEIAHLAVRELLP